MFGLGWVDDSGGYLAVLAASWGWCNIGCWVCRRGLGCFCVFLCG